METGLVSFLEDSVRIECWGAGESVELEETVDRVSLTVDRVSLTVDRVSLAVDRVSEECPQASERTSDLVFFWLSGLEKLGQLGTVFFRTGY